MIFISSRRSGWSKLRTTLKLSKLRVICLALLILCVECAAIAQTAFTEPPRGQPTRGAGPPISPGAPAQQGSKSGTDFDGALLTVQGDVGKTLSLSLADLSGLPRKVLTVKNEHSGADETYQGVPVLELLKRAGLADDKAGDVTMQIRAEGSDGYSATILLAELENGPEGGDVIVADTLNGEPIPANLGPLRLVVPGDKKPSRWVRMLRSLTVVEDAKQANRGEQH
jgi:DMSO/TMAO reductase YedYZ molybdopterin-dependent catalytic subunit